MTSSFMLWHGNQKVREDDKLSGKDRESKLSSLEGEYKVLG